MSTKLQFILSTAAFIIPMVLLNPDFCSAQIKQTERIEIPLGPDDFADDFSIVSAQTNGLIIYTKGVTPDKSFLNVTQMDTSLRVIWRGFIDIDKYLAPQFSVVYKNSFYVLCRSLTSGKGDLTLVVLDLATKMYQTFLLRSFISFVPIDFVVTSESVLIGGSFNAHPFILHFSTTTGQSKILPGFFNGRGELLQLNATPAGIINAVISGKNQDKKRCLWIKNYDADGTLIKNTILEPDHDKNLIFGRTVNLPGSEAVVAGVYGRSSELSRGLFVARIAADGEYKITYYNFAELDNFFRYMKTKRELRVKNRIARRKIRGKKNRFNYRFLVHELVPYGDQYVMLGEAFYPQYRSINQMGGAAMSSFGNTSVFDGYQYTHAVVIGFSKTGELLWDNSFEINDVKTFKLDQFVKIEPEKNHINLLYLIKNAIRSKIIRDNEVIEGKSMEPIKTSWDGDSSNPMWGGGNKLEYWYPGCLYAHGTQLIINTKNPGIAPRRKVLFINKITNR